MTLAAKGRNELVNPNGINAAQDNMFTVGTTSKCVAIILGTKPAYLRKKESTEIDILKLLDVIPVPKPPDDAGPSTTYRLCK
ncbi:hypothetical protein TNIN_318721 [Trichonephila inaurata madagascariensis]|uniref:Uncharacterized protein n=1 Tax=Trichonephila inaurata madagascariensis TaxID=2747483 RepID=A0A8X6XSI6_9ARAC|nr:hypothetical protein TNIN_318721 [Trichonephila inaurata madagascariensis]